MMAQTTHKEATGSEEASPPRKRRLDIFDSRLAFVSFALLMLVIGPIMTGALINWNERELLTAIDAAQTQVKAVQELVQQQRSSTDFVSIAVRRRKLDTALAAVRAKQTFARQRISALHDIQDAIIATFGLLSLIAAFYACKALDHMRATLYALDAERAKLAAVFNTANVGITLWNAHGALLDCNPAALDILGQTSEETLRSQLETQPLPVADVSTPDPSPLLLPLSVEGTPLPKREWPQWRALHGETFADQEVSLFRPDGSQRMVLVGGCPGLRGPDNAVTLGVNVFQDITVRRENERQLQELVAANDRRVHALESLFETAGHLSVSASPQEMHEYLTRRVARVLQVERVALWSYDIGQRLLTPLQPAFGFANAMQEGVQLRVQTGEWAHELLFHNMTVRSNDFTENNEPQYETLYAQLRDWNITSVLAVPLIAHGRPIGILCAYNKQENAEFTEEDVRLLRTFAGQAAFALHSAQQYARARTRSEHLAVLARLTQVVNSSLDLETLVPVFLQEARGLVPYRQVRLALRPVQRRMTSWSQEYPENDKEETELLRRLRGKAPHSKVAAQTETATKSRVTQAGEKSSSKASSFADAEADLILTADPSSVLSAMQVWTLDATATLVSARLSPHMQSLAHDDALWIAMQTGKSQHDLHSDPQRPSVLAIPLVIYGHLLGALEFSGGNGERYGENDLTFAHQAASQLAAAVQNARLYEEATHRAQQLEWSMEETHHRIKNNLQAVLSILDLFRMEAEDINAGVVHTERTETEKNTPDGNAETLLRQERIAREGLNHAMREVRTIAAVHDLLSEDVRNSRVNAQDMIERLVPLLLTASVTSGKHVEVNLDAVNIMLPSKLASALALTANELIVNAVRHGGQGRNTLALTVELKRAGGRLQLLVRDDGVGFPDDFDLRKQAHIGLNLTLTLIERDFGGTLAFSNNAMGGATVTATVPF